MPERAYHMNPNTPRMSVVVLIVTILVTLSGCTALANGPATSDTSTGETDTVTDTAAPTPAQTPTPTAAPTPTVTATSTPAPTATYDPVLGETVNEHQDQFVSGLRERGIEPGFFGFADMYWETDYETDSGDDWGAFAADMQTVADVYCDVDHDAADNELLSVVVRAESDNRHIASYEVQAEWCDLPNNELMQKVFNSVVTF